MVHEVIGGLMCPWYSLIPGLPTIQFLIACSTYSMPGNVLQAVKNCTVGRLGSNDWYVLGYFGDAQLELDLFAGFKSYLKSEV